MTTFYERNKQAIQCTAGAFVGGLALGAILMYTRTGTGNAMRKSVKKRFRKRMPKFSDLYPDTATPKTLGTPASVNTLYDEYKAKYNL